MAGDLAAIPRLPINATVKTSLSIKPLTFDMCKCVSHLHVQSRAYKHPAPVSLIAVDEVSRCTVTITMHERTNEQTQRTDLVVEVLLKQRRT